MRGEFWFGSITLFVVTFGCIGNLLVIISLSYKKKLLKKNNYYYLVLHLAFADLACLLFTVDYIFESFTGKQFAFSTVFCKLWSPLHTTFFIMEGEVMVLISLVRFRAVFYPLRAPLKRWKVNTALALAWVIAISSIAPLFVFFRYSSELGCPIVYPGQESTLVYMLFLSNVEYLIPLVLLSFTYQRMYTKIAKKNKERQLMIASPQMRKNLDKRKTFTSFKQDKNGRIFLVNFAIVFCYFVCVFPLQCLSIIMATGINVSKQYYPLSNIVYLAGVCSLNPFIYRVLDKRVFVNFKWFMTKRKGRKFSMRLSMRRATMST